MKTSILQRFSNICKTRATGAFGQLEEMLFHAAEPKSSLDLSVTQRDTEMQRASTTKTMSSDESPGTVEYEINISYISTSSLLYTVCTSGQPLVIFSFATHNHVHSTKHNLPSPSCNYFFPLTLFRRKVAELRNEIELFSCS